MLPDSSITFDDSRWPLRLVRFVGTPTPRQYEHYLETVSSSLRRRERYLSVTDLTRGGLPTPEQRQRQVLWMQEHEGLLREVVLGMAFVITSPVMRLSVSTVMHFKPLPVPYFVTAQEHEAMGWASARLEEQGLRLSPPEAKAGSGPRVASTSPRRCLPT
ncbi:MAG TPA: STAS/SEC14 domain-containing protein [Archangium sp.]|uniref:STAS/SEC14 domain-containing protein n=1 Tax=Archangium sp. TaxID=1872627 RepID=UPI002E3130B0|nr:STAS/SEC14 domain-containing protein [Archangium sp.]HEX5746645.1 STAS/SEC14 domain-containing protein [Archangium sp.]